MLKRIIIFALFAITINTTVKAQILATGDLVFTGYQASGPTTATDQFAFVPLVNLPVGTVIKFTDNAWNSTTLAFNTTESNTTFTVTPNPILAGRQVLIVLGPPAAAYVKCGGPTTNPATCPSAGTVSVAGAISLPTAGEQMIAYQGADLAPTFAQFITGIHMNVETGGCGVTTAAGWDPAACVFPTAPSNNTSMKPAAFTTDVNAIWITPENDNARFTNCGVDLSTPGAVRAAVNNYGAAPGNWTLDNNGAALPPWAPVTWSTCTFLGVTTAASVSVSGRVMFGKGSGLPKARLYLTDAQGNTRQTLSSAFGNYRFDDVEVGQTVTITVVSKQHQFTTQAVFVTEDVEDLNFTASP